MMSNEPDSVISELTWSDSLLNELRRFLYKRLKCPEAAADLAQETYLRLQKREGVPPDNARALAFHIAINLAVDYQRKLVVRDRYMVDADIIEQTANLNAHSPEEILIAQQRLKRLELALNELPPDCRTVFMLHGVEGLKYAEIADRLNISISMVGKHLARAMQHCAQSVEQ